MMVQLAVMDPYVKHIVIFAYVLMNRLVMKTRLLKLYKKKKEVKVHYLIHNYAKKMNHI